MSDLNKCMFIGRLGQDPELKYTSTGTAVCNISIACNRTWKDKQSGDKKEVTEWVRVVFYRQLAEIVARYLTKGSQCYVEGSMQTRKWQDSNGVDKYTTEVIANEMQMLGGRNNTAQTASPDADVPSNEQLANGPKSNYDEDDVPF